MSAGIARGGGDMGLETGPELAGGMGAGGMRVAIRRWVPLVVLVAGFTAFFALDLKDYLTLQSLADHREWLLEAVSRLGWVAPLAFVAIYAALIALSVPGALIMTLSGGFLFGTLAGGSYCLIAATLGATILFLIARTSLGEPLRRRAGPFLRKLEAGFQENAMSYLLILRLVPLFPFWLVNLVPAFLGVRLRTFVIGSFFGMAPATFIYASVGAGLGAVIAAGDTPDLRRIFQWGVLGPLIALAALAFVPVVYKWHKARQRRLSS